MLARAVDALDQIGAQRAWGKRHQADGSGKGYLLAEDVGRRNDKVTRGGFMNGE